MTAGRPPKYAEPMKQTAIWLPTEMLEWLKKQPGTMSETIRNYVEDKMNAKLNETKNRIEDALGSSWSEIVQEFGDRTLAEIKKQLDDMFPNDDNDQLAENLFWELGHGAQE